MASGWETDVDPRRCEYFGKTYLNYSGWKGHLSRCPIHTHEDFFKGVGEVEETPSEIAEAV